MNKFQTQISCCDRLDSELTVWLNIKLNIVLICLPSVYLDSSGGFGQICMKFYFWVSSLGSNKPVQSV